MIQRFQCLPKSLSRRQFGKMAMGVGTAVGAEYLASRKAKAAAGSPFTICLVPDPQYLAGVNGNSICGGSAAYNGLINWAITNRNTSILGVPLNVKGFLQVGDCCDNSTAGSMNAQQTNSVAAYALAEAASPKMFVVRCAGNHDYEGGPGNRNSIGYMFSSGPWSQSNLTSIYSGGMDLGNGDSAVLGGFYPEPSPGTIQNSSINNYMMFQIQGMRIGIISLEMCPRSSVMNWAKGIHDTHPTYQWWTTTHCYQTGAGAQCTRGTTGNGQFGPDNYSMGAAPASNCGTEMWGGSDVTWNGLTLWQNLTGTFCGHWLGGGEWARNPVVSTSTRSQTVQQVYCNYQSEDQANYCSSNPATPDHTSDVARLMLLRITPATQMMEAFIVSTNSGNYIGSGNSTPVQLFNVSMQTPTYIFPGPMSISQ